MKPISFIVGLILLVLYGTHGLAAQFELRPGDVVKIGVYGNPDLSIVTRISSEGMVNFPLIGQIEIAKLATPKAEKKIAGMLATKGVVKNPQVNIFIEKQYQAKSTMVTILGHVQKPGKYPINGLESQGIENIVDLLAAAGGVVQDAADNIVLIKSENEKEKKIQIDMLALVKDGDMAQNHTLGGGDVVFIPRMDVFYIYGEVQRPGQYRLEKNMTVMQALSISGSITSRGTDSGIIVKRKDRNGKINALDVSLTDTLQPNDVIYIKESMF